MTEAQTFLLAASSIALAGFTAWLWRLFVRPRPCKACATARPSVLDPLGRCFYHASQAPVIYAGERD